jgi:hypothetical protein
MGICYNNQQRMLHVMKNSVKYNNKRRQSTQIELIHNPVSQQTRHQNKNLSTADYSFLKSIGLKIRK